MEYRLNKQTLLDILGQWNNFLKRRVHLIACGGTALTLMNVKPSTKDVDFLVPDETEYRYLIRVIKDLGYKPATGSGWKKQNENYIFDLFPGKRIHTTELQVSPVEKENHLLLKEFSYLYIGILNDFDLVASKLFRGVSVDFEDCLMLVKTRKGKFDIERFAEHFKKLARYDISEDRILMNLERFLDLIALENISDE